MYQPPVLIDQYLRTCFLFHRTNTKYFWLKTVLIPTFRLGNAIWPPVLPLELSLAKFKGYTCCFWQYYCEWFMYRVPAPDWKNNIWFSCKLRLFFKPSDYVRSVLNTLTSIEHCVSSTAKRTITGRRRCEWPGMGTCSRIALLVKRTSTLTLGNTPPLNVTPGVKFVCVLQFLLD